MPDPGHRCLVVALVVEVLKWALPMYLEIVILEPNNAYFELLLLLCPVHLKLYHDSPRKEKVKILWYLLSPFLFSFPPSFLFLYLFCQLDTRYNYLRRGKHN